MTPFRFSFNRPESLWQKCVWRLYRLTAYLALVSPLYRLALRWKRIPKWLKWIVCPAFARQEPVTIFAQRMQRLGPCLHTVSQQVKRQGYADISHLIGVDTRTALAVKGYFLGQQAYDSQVPLQSSMRPQRVGELEKAGCSYVSFAPDVSMQHWLVHDIARSSRLKALADDYLGFSSSLYSVNTMLTFPSNGHAHGVTEIHRDYDDLLSLTCFVYWTDTTRDNGATFYVPGSHLGRGGEGVYLEGKAGSVFLVDTYGLHAGNKRVQTPRLATWLRFGETPNLAYVCDKNYLFF